MRSPLCTVKNSNRYAEAVSGLLLLNPLYSGIVAELTAVGHAHGGLRTHLVPLNSSSPRVAGSPWPLVVVAGAAGAQPVARSAEPTTPKTIPRRMGGERER